ncbi:hypothetical protein MJO28_005441 [Puccinia striiformis f. sp. tritici]|uniref:Uncharacterized protein n=1 Tax=Puccinia striiformis f. sp. tritici TaxID=168172 RepID=A0ACC0EM85_9BASI|nr:hypothetical protein MJO28_005441 [Puccinia striiformis f. sp. tritici]
MLIKRLNEAKMSYQAQEVMPAANTMLNKLTVYFEAAINKPVYLCSSILDPGIKTNVFNGPGIGKIMKHDKETIMEMFTIEAQQFSSNRYDQTSNKPNPKAPKNTLKSSIFANKRRKITSLNDKINCYLSTETEEELSDPVLYWMANSEHLPSLANMAQTYLAVPASSAPSKRAFSAACHI